MLRQIPPMKLKKTTAILKVIQQTVLSRTGGSLSLKSQKELCKILILLQLLVFLVTFDFCNCHIPAGNRVKLQAAACRADQLFQICLKGEAAVQALGNPGH